MNNSWLNYLHSIRKKEIEIAFSSFHSKEFENGLELGAGDAYQSAMIINYCHKLICTEFNEDRLKRSNINGIEYKSSIDIPLLS